MTKNDQSPSGHGDAVTARQNIPSSMLEPDLIENLPVAWLRKQRILPVRLPDGAVGVLTADPSRHGDIQSVSLAVGGAPKVVAVSPETVLDAIARCCERQPQTPSGLLESLGATDNTVAPVGDTAGQGGDLLERAGGAPAAQLCDLILLEAVKQGASDIHFEPCAERLAVRYRIDGILYERASPPKHLEQALVSRIKVMARMDIAERRLPQDGMAQVRVGERAIDIRVSSVPVADGERVVLRLLNRANAFLSLRALGMEPEVLADFNRLAGRPNGMLVVSGPTGSGKTTTLYAALGEMDAKRRNILTIEDPVEYRLAGIGQIQAQPKIGLSFATGLRHILRQDPDVILVGETRDLETAEIAVRASLTGHMVFTTLHTNDAPAAIMRLADMGVEPYLLASCLRGVLGQRLARRLCPKCHLAGDYRRLRDRVKLPPSWHQTLSVKPFMEADPRGCEACIEGFSGRVGIFELMQCDRDLATVIHSGNLDAAALREIAANNGMASLLDDGLQKIVAGLADPAEVAGVTAE